VSEYPAKDFAMSCEASALVRRVEPVQRSVKAAIGSAARRLGWEYTRTREIWYGRARRIDAHEMDALRREAQRQAARYDAIARAMEQTDPGFYCEDIASLVRAARALRGVDRAGDDPAGGLT